MGFLVLFAIPSVLGAVVFGAGRGLITRGSRRAAIAILAGTGIACALAFLGLRDPGLSLMRDGDTVLMLALIAGLGAGCCGALLSLAAPRWAGLAVAVLLPVPMWF